MNWRHVALGTLVVAAPNALEAQYRSPRSAEYLFGADVWGTRALWVHPAGLGTVNEASIMAEAMIERDVTGDYALAQYSFGLNSRGFGLGYRRDRFDGDEAGNVWRIGFGRGVGNLAFGTGLSVYSGKGREESVDLGLRWRPASPLEIALAAENIGQPTVRDTALRFAGALSAAWSPLRGLFHLAAEGRATDLALGGWLMAYRAGVRLATPGRTPLAAYAILDLDDDVAVRRLVAGVSVGGDYQGVLMGSGARRAGSTRVETISVAGVASHRFP